MNSYIIFSGLIGSLIGVIVSIGLYLYNQYESTKRAIVDRLEILLYDVYWNCSEQDVFKTWDASLKEILVLYNAFWDFALFKRGRARRSWENYKGEDHDIIKKLENEGMIVDNKSSPKNKQEFLCRILHFIKIIGK